MTQQDQEAAEPPEVKRWFYICDDCGNIVDISATPHDPADNWICDRCDDDGLPGGRHTCFTNQDEATKYADVTMNKNFAAKMAQLDQARAHADEMEGRS